MKKILFFWVFVCRACAAEPVYADDSLAALRNMLVLSEGYFAAHPPAIPHWVEALYGR